MPAPWRVWLRPTGPAAAVGACQTLEVVRRGMKEPRNGGHFQLMSRAGSSRT
jgi:hypothetical protein